MPEAAPPSHTEEWAKNGAWSPLPPPPALPGEARSQREGGINYPPHKATTQWSCLEEEKWPHFPRERVMTQITASPCRMRWRLPWGSHSGSRASRAGGKPRDRATPAADSSCNSRFHTRGFASSLSPPGKQGDFRAP